MGILVLDFVRELLPRPTRYIDVGRMTTEVNPSNTHSFIAIRVIEVPYLLGSGLGRRQKGTALSGLEESILPS